MNVFFKLHENGALPQRQKEASWGYDVFASEDIVLSPGKTERIKLGFSMEMPLELGAEIRSRSGIALNYGLFVITGTIDSDYRGIVCAVMHNFSNEAFYVKTGNRIAQLVFFKILSPEFSIKSKLSETSRNLGGFGSTGI